MHLVADCVYPAPRRGRCRVRIFLPEDERDAPVVVCSEMPTNRGESVTNAAERIAGGVIASYRLSVPVVWIEHYPPEATDGRSETFDLVVFGHQEVREIVRSVAEGSVKEVGPPVWKRLDRRSVEALVGQPLQEHSSGAGETA